MQQILLNAKIRDKTGKGISRRLRRQGNVPAVVYGRKEDPLTVEVKEREFEKASGMAAGQNVIINLKLDKYDDEVVTLIKDVQHHPVTDKLIHIDFYRISLEEKLTVSVPVVVRGESAGVKMGGILDHILWEVDVECLPTQIPDKIGVDISPMKIGDTLHVRDLKVEGGGKIITEGEKTILSVVPPTVVKEEVVEEAAGEPERVGEKEKVGEEKVEEKKEKEKEEGEKKAPKK